MIHDIQNTNQNWNKTPKKHRQKSWQQQHGGCRCDASFTFTTRPPQNICKYEAVTSNSRAGEPQPSMRTSAYQDIKRTNTSVAPLQKKKTQQSAKVMTNWINTNAISSVISPWEKLKYLARKMLHSSHVGPFQWLCNTTVRENLVCTKHTDLVTFDANRQHRPKTQKSLVRQHYAHHVLSITNECIISELKTSISWPFFPFFDTLSSHGTWMQHVMLCFLTPSYEILLYRTLLHPWVHSQSPQTFSNALRACLALGQWLQDEMWQPPHCARCFVVIHCSILGV